MSKAWSNIKKHAGETFFTKTGIKFTYHVRNDYIVLENTNRCIPRKQVEEALSLKSENLSDYQKYQGPSYLCALIHDARIR